MDSEQVTEAIPTPALVSFFYLLGRNKLPLGEVEELMRQCKNEPTQYSNKELAAWSDRMAKRLL